jgi:hypothetical protein
MRIRPSLLPISVFDANMDCGIGLRRTAMCFRRANCILQPLLRIDSR